MESAKWQTLMESGSPDTIVAFDFGLRRQEAGFSDLAKRLDIPCTLVKPEFEGARRSVEPERFCRALLDELGRGGRRVVGVFGYCAGASLACLLAEMATSPGEPEPRVLLFDPTPVDPSALHNAYLTGIDALREDLTEPEYLDALSIPVGGRSTNLPPGEEAGRLASLVQVLGEGYDMAVTACRERLGIDAGIKDELVGHVTAYLGYLATAAMAAGRRSGGTQPPVVLASRDHEVPERWVGHLHQRFETPRADLLADDRVASVAAGFFRPVPRVRRPRVKPEHAPYRIAGELIRIGGVSYGIAAEVNDPTGSVWTLLQSMDGTRTVHQVVDRVLERHPEESAGAIRDALKLFVDSGYVEDVGAPDPVELTEQDKERYARARAYFRWVDLTPRGSSWEPQVALRRSRVTVVGVGGTGGIAAMALAASGVGRLHCVDHDTVELSNLNRQVLYTEEDIGRPKVDAAVSRLRQLNSAIEVSGTRQRIEGVDDIASLAKDCDVLLQTADRPAEVRAWANRGCLATGTPWVDAGYHGPLVSVGTYVPGEGGCWECLRAGADDRHRALGTYYGDNPGRGGAVANAVGAPSAGLSGYLAAHCVVALITGAPPAPVGRIHAVNLVALDTPSVLDYPRRPDCPACGDPGVTAATTGRPARRSRWEGR